MIRDAFTCQPKSQSYSPTFNFVEKITTGGGVPFTFYTAGACALYVYGDSFHYFSQLESSSSATYILYFGYMTLICIALGIMTGSVGLFSTLYFNRTIYSYIKVE